MNNMQNEKPVWLVLLILCVGNILAYAPPIIQLVSTLTLIILIARQFLKDIKRENVINQGYVYFTGFSCTILFLLYIIAKNYLNINEKVIYVLLGLAILTSVYGIVMGIISRLKSGVDEQIKRAKFGIVLLSVVFILIIIIVVGIININ